MSIDAIIDEIIKREGGFTDHPKDLGGPTKYGITLEILSFWRKGEVVTINDVKKLTVNEAKRIYYAIYVLRPGFHMIKDDDIRALVVDCAVHHGVLRAVKWLQEAAGVDADGIIGPKTISAVNQVHPGVLYCKILEKRAMFFGEIISGDHSQAAFAKGWMRRLAEFIGKCDEVCAKSYFIRNPT